MVPCGTVTRKMRKVVRPPTAGVAPGAGAAPLSAAPGETGASLPVHPPTVGFLDIDWIVAGIAGGAAFGDRLCTCGARDERRGRKCAEEAEHDDDRAHLQLRWMKPVSNELAPGLRVPVAPLRRQQRSPDGAAATSGTSALAGRGTCLGLAYRETRRLNAGYLAAISRSDTSHSVKIFFIILNDRLSHM
jgi:hypothetical protein